MPIPVRKPATVRDFSIIKRANNWLRPDAPDSTGDYWVDTNIGDKPLTKWDRLGIDQFFMPGLWSVEPSASIGFDVTKILASIGSIKKGVGPTFNIKLTPKGYTPAAITATGEIWTAEDWASLKEVLPLISPKKTNDTAPRAHTIHHPACALLGIDQVVLLSVGVPKPVNQTLTIKLSFLQYFPQGPVLFDPHGGAGKPVISDAKPIANNNVVSK